MTSPAESPARSPINTQVDAVIVGAGFAGLYMLHRLRGLGLSAVVFEAAAGLGGTWYWNRYPGARCDAESLAYSYSFSEDLEQEWEWTERYATQPEILRYVEHVADRFDLRRSVHLNTRVTSAHFADDEGQWRIATDQGDAVTATYCVMATGCLSVPQLPDIPGIQEFSGELLQASKWPHHDVDFTGKRVGIIGTGSSGIQAIPVIAQTAAHLTVFQRTPNFSVPARNSALDASWVEEYKAQYQTHRTDYKTGRVGSFGDLALPDDQRGVVRETAVGVDPAEVQAVFEEHWQVGGARFIGAFADVMANEAVNAQAADFVHAKIRSIVKDPAVAELLCPTSHPIGTKRICVDTDYYATYNRPNVTLVDVASQPIEAIEHNGVRTGGTLYELDTLVLATGFDAMTGPLLAMDIRGSDGVKLQDAWAGGPLTYLGLMVAGFPNLFTITGPGSPSVLSNMLVSIEQHVDWLTDLLAHAAAAGKPRIEADPAAQAEWVEHVNMVANATLFPRGGSWYLGANVPGKPRVFMPYAGGVGPYRELCDQIAADDYRGLRFG